MDPIFGSNGNDTIIPGSASAGVTGGVPGDGKDTIFGGAGNDVLSGGGDDDLIFGLPDNDSISGGVGDDVLSGDDGNDTVLGDAGDDGVNGGKGNDSLSGGDGNDAVGGDDGVDTLDGGAGDDTLLGGGAPLDAGQAGNIVDRVTGGAGADTFVMLDSVATSVNSSLATGYTAVLDYTPGQGDKLLLSAAVLGGAAISTVDAIAFKPAQSDDLPSLPVIFCGSLAPQAAPTPGLTLPPGTAGDFWRVYWMPDVGGGGWLVLDLDRDGTFGTTDFLLRINGAASITAADFVAGSFATVGSALNDSLAGTSGADIINGLAGNDTISGLGGKDTLEGAAGNDQLDGGDGDDQLSGGLGNDLLAGGDGSDRLDGGDGDDFLSSGAGTSFMIGGAGNDTITGGVDNDVVQGGAGADQLVGGAGSDNFTFTLAPNGGSDATFAAQDLILDFSTAQEDTFTVGYSDPGSFSPAPLIIWAGSTGSAIASLTAGYALPTNSLVDAGPLGWYVPANGGGGWVVVDMDQNGLVGSTDFVVAVAGSALGSTKPGGGWLVPGDFILGTNAADAITDLPSTADRLFGGNGNDTLTSLYGAATDAGGVDTLIGGAGIDLAVVLRPASTTPIFVNLIPDAVAYQNPVVLKGIERLSVEGGLGGDTLVGVGGADYLSGASGADLLFGGGGADTLTGGNGDTDTVTGVESVDTFGLSVAADGSGHSVLADGAAITDFRIGVDKLALAIIFNLGIPTAVGSTKYTGADGVSRDVVFAGALAATAAPSLSLALPDPTSGFAYAAYWIPSTTSGTGWVLLDSDRDSTLSAGDLVMRVNFTGGSAIGESDFLVNTFSFGLDIYGTGAAESINGGGSGDFLAGAAGNDTIDGGSGNDGLGGGAGNDSLIGGAGDDSLTGNDGIDTLVGGAGNDSYVIDTNSDTLVETANGGTDTITVSFSLYLPTNFENLTLAVGAGDIFGVGNAADNAVTGNAGANLLLGGTGNDSIDGGAGNDALFGEAGDDSLVGGAGIDYLVGGAGNDSGNGGADADALYGEAGNDSLSGGSGFVTDILVGGDGNDTLDGASGTGDYDLLDGSAGDDTYLVDTPDDLTFEAAAGGTDLVIASITGAGYYLYAEVENLTLAGNTPFGVGNGLNNVLTGSVGANWLLGGAGDDTLNGKGGNDVLFGEAGADTFTFERGTGADVIGDFAIGIDKIRLLGLGFSTFAQVQAAMSVAGSNSAIDFGQGDFVVLNGVTNLVQADVLFA